MQIINSADTICEVCRTGLVEMRISGIATLALRKTEKYALMHPWKCKSPVRVNVKDLYDFKVLLTR